MTFLDVASLARIGSDTQAKLDEMQMINETLKQRNANNAENIAEMQKEMENMKNMLQSLLKQSSSQLDYKQQTELAKSMYRSGWLTEVKDGQQLTTINSSRGDISK